MYSKKLLFLAKQRNKIKASLKMLFSANLGLSPALPQIEKKYLSKWKIRYISC